MGEALSMVFDVPIVPVPTTMGIAFNLSTQEDRVVCPLMNARRNQTYTAVYAFDEGKIKTLVPQTAVPIEDIISRINDLGRPVTFLGDGVGIFDEAIRDMAKVPVMTAPAHLRRQRASSFAYAALQLLEEGEGITADDFRLDYIRLPQAVREKLEKVEKVEKVEKKGKTP